MKIKKELYSACEKFMENRLKTIQSTITEIQKALTSETKSSAGDKHETGRAMLQLEREKAGNQLAEISKVKEALFKVDVSITSERVTIGSVVYTTKSNYFIAISAGELHVNKEKFYAISPNTPIGQLLIGKNSGDSIQFRNQDFTIEKVI